MFTAGTFDHPTFVHQLVWWEGLSLTPLSLTLPGLKTGVPDLIQSCKNLRGFWQDLLEDMYERPEAYYLETGEYEVFLNGRSEIEARRENKAKHNQTRSKNYARVGFHQQFLFEVSRCGQASGEGLSLDRADYEAAIRKVGKSPYLKGVDTRTRIAALERQGIDIAEDGAKVTLTCQKAPDIFLAMSRLSQRADKRPFGPLNFTCCNFQQIERDYIPDFPVVTHVLAKDLADRAQRINQYAGRLKMSPRCYVIWKMGYACKGQAALRISTLYGHYEVHVNYGLNGAELACFEQVLVQQSKDIQDFCMEHLNYCRRCGYCETDRPGTERTILGRTRRTCGYPALSITDPEEADLAYIEKAVDLRVQTLQAAR